MFIPIEIFAHAIFGHAAVDRRCGVLCDPVQCKDAKGALCPLATRGSPVSEAFKRWWALPVGLPKQFHIALKRV